MRRDPPEPKEARAIAERLFAELARIPYRLRDQQINPEYVERAAVLADVLQYTDRPDVGEMLANAVAGRWEGLIPGYTLPATVDVARYRMTVPPRETRSTKRDPPSQDEARKIAKQLFADLDKISPRASSPVPPRHGGEPVNPEFFERASVLADVLAYTDRPDLAEQLALILNRQGSRLGNYRPGTLIPRDHAAKELASSLLEIYSQMFPRLIGEWQIQVRGVTGRGPVDVVVDSPDWTDSGIMGPDGIVRWDFPERIPARVRETAAKMLRARQRQWKNNWGFGL